MVAMRMGNTNDIGRRQGRTKLKGIKIDSLAPGTEQKSVMAEPAKIFENFLYHTPPSIFLPNPLYNQFDTFRNLL
jgi:hypothetical protein